MLSEVYARLNVTKGLLFAKAWVHTFYKIQLMPSDVVPTAGWRIKLPLVCFLLRANQVNHRDREKKKQCGGGFLLVCYCK